MEPRRKSGERHGGISDHSQLPTPAQVEYLDTARGQIAVRRTPVRGSGPHEPAVMLHGLGGNAAQWVDLADAMSDRLDVVCPDLPGFGFSPPDPDGDHSLGSLLAAAVAVTEAAFPGQPVHLFGNSMGGLIMTQLAAQHPELAQTLCLISPAMPGRIPMRSNVFLPVMGIPVLGGLAYDRYVSVGAAQMARAEVELVYADPSRVHPQRLAENEAEKARIGAEPHAKEVFRGATASVVAAFMQGGTNRPWAMARRVQVPTLLIYGRQDRLVDPKTAHRSAKEFRDALVMIIPDAGHVAMMEHPELVDRWWRQFVDSRRAAAATA